VEAPDIVRMSAGIPVAEYIMGHETVMDRKTLPDVTCTSPVAETVSRSESRICTL